MGIHVRSLEEARPVLREMWRKGETIGSVHSLGALHIGHGKVIEAASKENQHTIVTVYPNKIQLAPGSVYRYDLERDVEFAFKHGATHVISSHDAEMFPPGFSTYIDQQPMHQRLDATYVPFIFRGMITGCLRWISFCRPTRSYWGLKDIGQYLLVKKAVKDLLIDSEVRPVPCVRFQNGVPISSRIFGLPDQSIKDLESVYQALQSALQLLRQGERRSSEVIKTVLRKFEDRSGGAFKIGYIKVVNADTFEDVECIELPCIVHVIVTNGSINCFDGLLIRDEQDLKDGPPAIWIDEDVFSELSKG